MSIERMWYDAIGYFSHNVNTADLSHANVVIQYLPRQALFILLYGMS